MHTVKRICDPENPSEERFSLVVPNIAVARDYPFIYLDVPVRDVRAESMFYLPELDATSIRRQSDDIATEIM